MSKSIVAASAVIAGTSTLGEFCVIGERVKIGHGCVIGHHVIMHDDVQIGDNVRIDDGTVIGKLPMRAANSAVTKDQQLPPTRIGSNGIIGAHVIIYRGCTIGEKVLIADLSTVRENVSVGDYTIVGRGVAIENYCTIGRYVKLETNVYLTAYSEVEDRCFLAPCVATSNDNYIGRTEERFKHFKGVIMRRGARIGVNATILPGITIGADALVAAGALVTKDVPEKKIVAGVPAKVFRDVPSEQWLDNQGWKE
ncbi:MAG: DapH/DapD/GlmU-related protein [candidate division Zixibacteria bacterium]|jgi:serine O-acetyltransferase|nr:DapH/DapD/GlmU-related protein [candidate division Zixibacteria bacterium]